MNDTDQSADPSTSENMMMMAAQMVPDELSPVGPVEANAAEAAAQQEDSREEDGLEGDNNNNNNNAANSFPWYGIEEFVQDMDAAIDEKLDGFLPQFISDDDKYGPGHPSGAGIDTAILESPHQPMSPYEQGLPYPEAPIGRPVQGPMAIYGGPCYDAAEPQYPPPGSFPGPRRNMGNRFMARFGTFMDHLKGKGSRKGGEDLGGPMGGYGGAKHPFADPKGMGSTQFMATFKDAIKGKIYDSNSGSCSTAFSTEEVSQSPSGKKSKKKASVKNSVAPKLKRQSSMKRGSLSRSLSSDSKEGKRQSGQKLKRQGSVKKSTLVRSFSDVHHSFSKRGSKKEFTVEEAIQGLLRPAGPRENRVKFSPFHKRYGEVADVVNHVRDMDAGPPGNGHPGYLPHGSPYEQYNMGKPCYPHSPDNSGEVSYSISDISRRLVTQHTGYGPPMGMPYPAVEGNGELSPMSPSGHLVSGANIGHGHVTISRCNTTRW